MKVFILENVNPNINIQRLYDWGDVHIMFSESVTPLESKRFAKDALKRLQEMDFDPKQDAIAVIGKISRITMLALLLLKRFGKVKLLLHSSQDNRYVKRTITLPFDKQKGQTNEPAKNS